MRIDKLNNIQSIWQREKQRNRRRMVYFFLIVLGSAYLVLIGSLFISQRSGQDTAKFENDVIRVSGTADADGLTLPAVKPATLPTYRPAGKITHNYSQTTSSSAAPQHTWKSTSGGSGIKVHTTSSATVKNVGSGASFSGGQVSGVTVTAQSSAFGTSTSIMVVPTIARVSSRNLNAANTMAAEAEVINTGTSERQGKAGIKTWGDHDPDPMLDPIGDGLWALLILALGYGAFMFYRRKSHSIIHNP